MERQLAAVHSMVCARAGTIEEYSVATGDGTVSILCICVSVLDLRFD